MISPNFKKPVVSKFILPTKNYVSQQNIIEHYNQRNKESPAEVDSSKFLTPKQQYATEDVKFE